MLAGAKQFPATNSTHMLATATQNYCCYVPHCRHLRRYTQAPRFPFTLPPHCIRLSMLNARFQSQNLTLPLQSMSIKANFYWRRQHQYCCCLLLMAAGVAALLLLLLLHFLLVCCSSLYKCACYYCYCIANQRRVCRFIVALVLPTTTLFLPSSLLLLREQPLLLRIFDCLTAIAIGLCHSLVRTEFANLIFLSRRQCRRTRRRW